MSEKTLKAGDIVSIRGQVVSVDETGAVTVEVSCDERKNKHCTTFTGDQVAHAISFVKEGTLPEADKPFTMDDVFAKGKAADAEAGVETPADAEVITIEQADVIGMADEGKIV